MLKIIITQTQVLYLSRDPTITYFPNNRIFHISKSLKHLPPLGALSKMATLP